MLEKDLEGKRCGAKKLYPHPKSQGIEPRKRRFGIGTISCVFGEERRIKRL